MPFSAPHSICFGDNQKRMINMICVKNCMRECMSLLLFGLNYGLFGYHALVLSHRIRNAFRSDDAAFCCAGFFSVRGHFLHLSHAAWILTIVWILLVNSSISAKFKLMHRDDKQIKLSFWQKLFTFTGMKYLCVCLCYFLILFLFIYFLR